MTIIDFNRHLDALNVFARRCRPRVLVVSDGLLEGDADFGLSHFLSILGTTPVYGRTPVVDFRDSPDTSWSDDLDRYDVLFLFGVGLENEAISDADVDAVARFMQNGGGVFATGDHEDLGAGLCGRIPRVRSMRRWAANETPSASESDRITTNLPGDDRQYAFDDEEDSHPQRLYPNFAVGSDRIVLAPPNGPSPARPPHPILRQSDGSALDVYPDHPHEGECRVDVDLGSTFELDGTAVAEWPRAGFLWRPRPRAVAYSMSAGNGFSTPRRKTAVVPRSFISIAAFDGQVAGVGRVVTDSTWHHYINRNLKGMKSADGSSNGDLRRIERFWRNTLTWLAPARVRWCLFPWLAVTTLLEHHLAEELTVPERADPDAARVFGAAVSLALADTAGSPMADVGGDIAAELAVRAERDAEAAGSVFAADSHDECPVRSEIVESLVGAHVIELLHAISTGDQPDELPVLESTVERHGREVIEAVVRRRRSELERATSDLEALGEQLAAAR